MMAYYRTGTPGLALRSMATQWAGFALPFRMDSPLQYFGSTVYQPSEPVRGERAWRSRDGLRYISVSHDVHDVDHALARQTRTQINIVIDAFGVNAALVRGLFEYL